MSNDKKKSKKVIWIIVLIISLLVFLGASYLLLFRYLGIGNRDLPDDILSTDTESEEISDTDTEDNGLAENPVNFENLRAINSDIYAWISIPGCDIEYPIIQPTMEDDLYYLRRNIYREYEYSGTIFTEKNNTKSFEDPNTLIYGHNMLDGTMFSNLLNFRDENYFNEHEYIYIYTPGMKFTYRIFAAYQYDKRHILNSFDFSDEEVFAQYLKDAQNPKSMISNTREVEMTTEDKIITLSTCTGANWDYRYLVQGVLIKYEQTK